MRKALILTYWPCFRTNTCENEMCLSQPLNENPSGENNSLPKISQKNEQRISSLGKVIYDLLIARLLGASVYHDQILLLSFVRWLLKISSPLLLLISLRFLAIFVIFSPLLRKGFHVLQIIPLIHPLWTCAKRVCTSQSLVSDWHKGISLKRVIWTSICPSGFRDLHADGKFWTLLLA